MSGLERLKKLEAVATPRPWKTATSPGLWVAATTWADVTSVLVDHKGGCLVQYEHRPNNAALTAAMRNCLPELLAVVETLLAERACYGEHAPWVVGIDGDAICDWCCMPKPEHQDDCEYAATEQALAALDAALEPEGE